MPWWGWLLVGLAAGVLGVFAWLTWYLSGMWRNT